MRSKDDRTHVGRWWPMVVLRRDLDCFWKVSLEIATSSERLGVLANITVSLWRGKGLAIGNLLRSVDNSEADMGVLIFTGSGRSIAAAYKCKEYQWPVTIRLPTTVVMCRECQKSRRSLID